MNPSHPPAPSLPAATMTLRKRRGRARRATARRLRRFGAWEMALESAYRRAAAVYAGIDSRQMLRICRGDHRERIAWVNQQLTALGAAEVTEPSVRWRLAIWSAERLGPRWIRAMLEVLERGVRRRYERIVALSDPELAGVVERRLLVRQRFTEATCWRAVRMGTPS